MTLLKAIIMGIVQGVAEFLPISSSGHLALFKHILGVNLESGMLFDVLLHVGTLAAVFIAFFADIKNLVIEGFGILGDFFANLFNAVANLFRKEKKPLKKVVRTPYRRFVMLIIVSTIPTGIVGLLLKDITEAAGNTLIIPGICFVLTAIELLVAENWRPKNHGRTTEKNAKYREAIIVGTAQGIATFPGLSRSGTTITAGIMCGFEKNFAVRYSFIMSIPAILGALVLELKDIGVSSVSSTEALYFGIGAVVAGVVGYFAIKLMLETVRKKKYRYFAYYCFVIGLIAIFWNLFSIK